MMDNQNILAEIEVLIERYRWARPTLHSPENRTFNALKAVARELRSRTPDRANATVVAIQRRIDDVERAKTENGYATPAMVGLAQEVLSKWQTIRSALMQTVNQEKSQNTY